MSRPCERPECGGEIHTDPWGTPAQCPHADTGQRCPRCDCADGHTQCEHCKVCPYATAGEQLTPRPDSGRTGGPCVCDAAGSPGVSRCLLTCPRRPEKSPSGPTYEPDATVCPLVYQTAHDAHTHEGLRCPGWEPDSDKEGRAEAPTEGELNPALPVRPDPRQPAYDAVYEYIRALGPYLPPDPVHRNAVIWRAVHAALDATPVGRCVSSHCVEGDHMIFNEGGWETP